MKKRILLSIVFSICVLLQVFSQATGIVISNLPSGGSIGAAASTVDVGSYFNINQTTSGQTITIPNPTTTTATKNLRIRNIGSVAFTLSPGGICNPSTFGIELDWTGSTWAVMSNPSIAGSAGNLTGAVTSIGLATSLGYFTSANLSGALTNETGHGLVVFDSSATLITPRIDVGSDADGDIYYRSSNVFTRLPIGSSGKVLSVQLGLPVWNTPSVVSAANGLSINSNNVILGGSSLSNTTTITGANQVFNIPGLNQMNITSSNGSFYRNTTGGGADGYFSAGNTLSKVQFSATNRTGAFSASVSGANTSWTNLSSAYKSEIQLDSLGIGMKTGVGSGVFYGYMDFSALVTANQIYTWPNTPGPVAIGIIPIIVTDATDANYTAVSNTIKYLPVSTLSANRNIIIPTGANGDVLEIYNNEVVFVWNLTGASVYLSDGTTVVTSLMANANYLIRKVSGKWRILN